MFSLLNRFSGVGKIVRQVGTVRQAIKYGNTQLQHLLVLEAPLSASISWKVMCSASHLEYSQTPLIRYGVYNDILYITIYTPWLSLFWCNITIIWLLTISLRWLHQNRCNQIRFCMGGALFSPYSKYLIPF
jgi:hypothetical protein